MIRRCGANLYQTV